VAIKTLQLNVAIYLAHVHKKYQIPLKRRM